MKIFKIFQLRPCCGVAVTVDERSPRPGGQVDALNTQALAAAPAIYAFYPSLVMREALWKFCLVPFTDTHTGRRIGLVLFARIRKNSVCLWGVCERQFVPAVLSIADLSQAKALDFGEKTPGSYCLKILKVVHVAVLRKSLGAYNTFLNRGWKLPAITAAQDAP